MAEPRVTVASRRNTDGSFTLPSGAVATIEGMTVKQLDLLGNKKKLKSGAAYDQILAECAGFDPDKALIGDRVFALVAIRIETHGSDYQVRCKCPACDYQFTKAIDLETLDVQELQHGPGPFEFTLPKSGRRVTYRLLTGADEKRMITEFGEDLEKHGLSLPLAMRTIEIEGAPFPSRKVFEEMKAADATAYIDDANEHDCGVETSVSVECPKCEQAWQASVNLDPTFLLPSKAKK